MLYRKTKCSIGLKRMNNTRVNLQLPVARQKRRRATGNKMVRAELKNARKPWASDCYVDDEKARVQKCCFN